MPPAPPAQQGAKVCPACGQPAPWAALYCGSCRQPFPPSGYYPQQAQWPGGYPGYPTAYPPYAARPAGDATGYVIGAVICSLVSLLFCPPGFGVGAILCANQVKTRGRERLGTGLMVAAIACMVVGFVFGAFMWMSRLNGMGRTF